MSYELIKKIIIEHKPMPCKYCSKGWCNYGGKEVKSCTDVCEIYKAYMNGEIVVPEGFDEVREIKE